MGTGSRKENATKQIDRAFSREVDTGSRKENALDHRPDRASHRRESPAREAPRHEAGADQQNTPGALPIGETDGHTQV
ncbi:hypothetical protein [Bosea sp. BK604]|uniref:hypothetical protein n=1 Tax=Bosea sp. BK604 TaxID=2512180 RepID=UPI001A9D8F5D|nr:hypothetical protein [Bosea sp. BK604]